MLVLCEWFPAKCNINTQFLSNILFTDAAAFTGDGISKFIMSMSGRVAVPTTPWHRDLNIDVTLVSSWAFLLSALMLEAISSPEKWGFTRSTRHIPQCSILYSHRENLNSHKNLCVS
jgi:hypothetical protein